MANFSRRRVYWPSQETLTDWVPSDENTAGSFDLSTDGSLVCGRASRGQTLLWTTTDLWVATYIGGEFLYSFSKVGMNCGIISRQAVVVLDTAAYWMGHGKFFMYDGFVKTIPCEVGDYVFGDFDSELVDKIWTLANPTFNEITWFYNAASNISETPNRYVTYNYVENHWTFGMLDRTTGITRDASAVVEVPVMISSDGTIYDHETLFERSGHEVFLESGPMEVGNGDQVQRIQRIVPDDNTVGDVSASLYTALAPDDPETLNGPYTLSVITSVRLTARQVRIRLAEVIPTAWRVGVIRLGAIAGGRR